jgi:phosphate starvation-inducible PhoH-like protein
MSKHRSKEKDRRSKSRYQEKTDETVYEHPNLKRQLKPLNSVQKSYIDSIRTNTITFGLGAAGTGKTFIPAAIACELLASKKISKVVITRPNITAGEDFGFLPGTLEEKYSPFLTPLVEVFNQFLGQSFTKYLFSTGVIQAQPLAFLRGWTFEDCFVILDEAQNTTPEQMKLFLTRIGENCTYVIDGDLAQKDLPTASGLQDAITRLKGLPSIGLVNFPLSLSVRSPMVRQILAAYS